MRDTGFCDSGRSLPLINITINTGTSVMANNDENPTASVFVHASGRNMRPSCASSKKTGRKETTMIRREKNSAGPTCLAAAIKIFRRSRSGTTALRWTDDKVAEPFDVREASGDDSVRPGRSDKWR